MTHHGYNIIEIFTYNDGKSDWQVYPPHGEYGVCKQRMTLLEVLADIEEEEQEKQLK